MCVYCRVTQEYLVNLDSLDLMASLVSQEVQEHQDLMELLVHRGQRDQQDPRDPKGLPEVQAALVKMGVEEILETLERRELKGMMEMPVLKDRLVSKGNKDLRGSPEQREIKERRCIIGK